MTRPLAGIRILDLTRLLPGGVCTMLLADMGAEIIKIEAPDGGDYARWMPPLIDGQGAYFAATNRGKKSVILNLKDAQGQAILRRMAARADVLIESYRPGVMDRLNVGYEALKKLNPRLIFCALSGWGADGAYAERSGHDLNYASVAGLIGEMNTPQPMGGQVADIGGAYAAAAGISAALVGRERTGEGAFLDISLFESALPFMALAWVESVLPGDHTRGGLSGKVACYNVYTALDGRAVALAALEPKFWANFCGAVGRPDLIDGYTDPGRQRYLTDELAQMFALKTADEWGELLEGADCCFTRVNTPAQALNDPHVRGRQALGLTWSGVPYLHSPIRMSGDLPSITPAPGYGEHTRAVLLDFGYTDAEIDVLCAASVIKE
ncbi:MAG: CoA transferase [Anaerolinea sp.]|nr:CoA transferase [Anaerolinea sp.]